MKLLFILFTVLLELIIIISIYLYENKYDIQIAITACNRVIYLNSTLKSLFDHFIFNDRNIQYNIIYIDQGTSERYFIRNYYNLKNSFFINPKDYGYSFNILFSYIYKKYTFILEEDWIIKSENKNINNNFLSNSIIALSLSKNIYGIILRNMVITNATYISVHIDKKKMKMINLIHPFQNRNFLNGPTMYNSKILKKLNIYYTEFKTGLYFLKINYYLAFLCEYYKLKSCVKFEHIGKNSTKLGICNRYLY